MIGRKISHYNVTEKLGAGGMGEVYRATDTKLGRDVALKILPEEFARDAQRMARFSREAQVLASLNHPNIASIYGLEESDGIRCLVLELVEGPTLAERIAAGPLPAEEALNIARQITEALEAAHEKGIIHRDLKPANVKVTPEGTVKVLDFGLAKALEDDLSSIDISESPTLSVAATQAGVILGTAAYMSPEQAHGRQADKRADIWAFGVVLYEMLTGRQAFSGESISDTLASVLKLDPDWDALPSDTPQSIRKLLRRCLTRDRKQRLQAIGEARIAIKEYLADPTGSSVVMAAPALPVQPAWQRALPWSIAAVAVVIAGVGLWSAWRATRPAPGNLVRFSVTLPPTEQLFTDEGLAIALTPGGTRLVYVAGRSGGTQLFLREMDSFEASPLPGTEGGYNPFFSPDGQWVGFFAGGKLKKVSVEGGSPLVLADARWGHGSWGADDNIIFTPSYPLGLWRVSAAGGTPEELTTPDVSQHELGHWWPQILPGGKAVLFTSYSTPIEKARIAVLDLETGQKQTLIEGAVFGRYVPTGHLVYVQTETLMAVPFDLARLQVTGPPVPVLEDVPVDTVNGNSQFSISDDGSLVYIPASVVNTNRLLVWVDRKGTARPVTEARRRYMYPKLSPDGRRLALTIVGDSRDVWVYELARGTLTRLTFGAANEFRPLWTPDGRRLIFVSEQLVFDLYWLPVDGSAPAEPLFTSEYDKHPISLSPDGKILAFVENHPDTRQNIWLLPLEGERRPQPLLRTQFAEMSPAFSPDGRWLAYQSNESGRNEVYVQAYPGPGGKVQVSTGGGTEPVWARNGRELFYRNGDKMMAVQIGIESGFRAGKPRLLFEGSYEHFPPPPGYDITPDGQRFVMVKTPPESAPRQLNVVLNWFEEVRRRVPAGKD